MTLQRSSAVPLAGVYAALVVYASLYPFTGWTVPGVSVWHFLTLPFPHWWTAFDLIANLLGYLPLGALVFGAMIRSANTVVRSMVVATAAGAALSFAMEMLQNFLPMRVPSNLDLVLNAAGSALGASMGAAVNMLGGMQRWQVVRERWFISHSAGGLALLILWPVGLLFPTPVPYGLGQVWPRLRDGLAVWLSDSSVAEWIGPWLQGDSAGALSPAGEFVVAALGLMAPCLVAYTISRPGWRRMVLAVGAAAAGFGATTLSTALNFGPQHALAWRTPSSMAALIAGLALALLLAFTPRRVAAAIGLMVLTAMVSIIGQAPADAYFADSLQAWEQGRFIRFHGVAQWVGWLWPYAAMVWLLVRITQRDSGQP